MEKAFPTFLTGYAPGAADGWADVPKRSGVKVNVEQTGVTFGRVSGCDLDVTALFDGLGVVDSHWLKRRESLSVVSGGIHERGLNVVATTRPRRNSATI